jgi:hypothetical protein
VARLGKLNFTLFDHPKITHPRDAPPARPAYPEPDPHEGGPES